MAGRAGLSAARAIVGVVVATLAVGLLNSGGISAAKSTTTTTQPRPSGPAAELSPLTGGNGAYMARLEPDDVKRFGYTEREYAASGTASGYTAEGALSADGRWTFAPDGSAPYRTRVLVRRPAKAADFSGTVIVEWLNVSPGIDNEPEWANTHSTIVRDGDAWIGVSAQRIGVEGGPVAVRVDGAPGAEVAGKGLKAIDAARYGSLEHPGDTYSYDIFTQVARAARAGTGLGGLRPKHVVAAGQSQSAAAMVTYINGVQPLTRAFDGFFVHSRFASGLPLVPPGQDSGLAGAISRPAPTIIRTDLGVPVMDVQTETDVTSIVNSYAARQDDSNEFRLWEVAGTAHADRYQMGDNADLMNCGVPVNDGPVYLVATAAMHAFTNWVATGKAPPRAPRLDVVTSPPLQAVRDDDGIAEGGIRTPPVDVPVEALSGERGPNPSTICLLLGSAPPLSDTRLAELYPSRAAYLKQFKQSADSTIKAGFVLPEDKKALLKFAQPSRVSG